MLVIYYIILKITVLCDIINDNKRFIINISGRGKTPKL